jgi:hypothetical protein
MLQISTTTGGITSFSVSMHVGELSALPTLALTTYTYIVSMSLDRTNYLLWRTYILPNIVGKGWYGFLDGSCAAPP